MDNQVIITYPQGLIVPGNGTTTVKTEILLTASELEQVRAAIEHGKHLIQIRLSRTKKSFKRYTTTIEQNTINSVLYKVEHSKPLQLYPVELLADETAAVIYCLEHTRNSKSKDVQQLIHTLNSYLTQDCEG